MSKEEQEKEASQTKPVTDADLDRAAEELVDLGPYELEETEDAPKEDEESAEGVVEEKKEDKEEPEDNAERSRLGRKVAHLETVILDLTAKLESFGGLEDKGKATEKVEEKQEDGDGKTNLRKMLRELQEEEANEKRNYESKYLTKIFELGKTAEEEEHQLIVDLMIKKHNKVIHNNPSIDAELNYRAAEAEFYKTKRTEKKVNLKGDKAPKVEKPESKAVGDEALDVDLDEYSKEFIAKTGMSLASVKKALGKK